MFSLPSPASRFPQSLTLGPQSLRGFSLLDLLITLLVLALVLLAAVKQFDVYKQPAQQPAPSAQSTPAQS